MCSIVTGDVGLFDEALAALCAVCPAQIVLCESLENWEVPTLMVIAGRVRLDEEMCSVMIEEVSFTVAFKDQVLCRRLRSSLSHVTGSGKKFNLTYHGL